MAEPDFSALRRVAEREFGLPKSSLHGPSHWARVEANALRLAQGSGVDVLVVRLFAPFHDIRRQSDGDDPEHGRRAATFLVQHRSELFQTSDDQFALLREAVAPHANATKIYQPFVPNGLARRPSRRWNNAHKRDPWHLLGRRPSRLNALWLGAFTSVLLDSRRPRRSAPIATVSLLNSNQRRALL